MFVILHLDEFCYGVVGVTLFIWWTSIKKEKLQLG
jgi:hypothetical protein